MKLVDVATGETVGTASEKYNDLNMLVDDSNRLVLGMLGAGREILPAVESPQRDSEIQNTGTSSSTEFRVYSFYSREIF